MRARAWKRIARRWWRVQERDLASWTDADSYDSNRVYALAERPSKVVPLLEALAAYVRDASHEEWGLHYIGTAVMESFLMAQADRPRGRSADQILWSLHLEPEVLAQVLDGMYPQYREQVPTLMTRVPTDFVFRT